MSGYFLGGFFVQIVALVGVVGHKHTESPLYKFKWLENPILTTES